MLFISRGCNIHFHPFLAASYPIVRLRQPRPESPERLLSAGVHYAKEPFTTSGGHEKMSDEGLTRIYLDWSILGRL